MSVYFFFTILKAEKSKIKTLAGLSGSKIVPCHHICQREGHLYPHTAVEQEQETPLSFAHFIAPAIPPDYTVSQQTQPPQTAVMGITFLTHEFGRHIRTTAAVSAS